MTGNKFRKTLSIFFLLFSLVLSTTATTTVNATVPASSSRISYSGNGSTTSFPFSFGVTDDDELIVQVDGIATTAFTVTCPANNCLSGGTVVMATAPPSGSTLTILRDIDITQESDFVEGSPDLAQTFEEQLDKQTMILQQLREQIGRAPKINAGSPYGGMSYTLPDPVPGNVIGWNTAGSDLTNYDNSGGSAVADSPIIVVNTIAELRNIIPTDGKLCNVTGYYAPGDGGGGPERVGVTGAAAGTYIDNGINIIVPTGGDGSAAWVFDVNALGGVVYADWCGITGSTGHQTRFAAAYSAGFSIIIAGPRDYTFDAQLTVPAGRGLLGTDVKRTRILAVGCTPIYLPEASDSYAELGKLSIIGDGTADTYGFHVYKSPKKAKIHDLYITGFGTSGNGGIFRLEGVSSNTWGTTLDDIVGEYCGRGGVITNSQAITLNNVITRHNAGPNVWQNCGPIIANGGAMEKVQTAYGATSGNGYALVIDTCWHSQCYGTYFETSREGLIKVKDSLQATFLNCPANGVGDGVLTYGQVYFENSHHCRVSNSRIGGLYSGIGTGVANIYLDANSKNNTIEDNILEPDGNVGGYYNVVDLGEFNKYRGNNMQTAAGLQIGFRLYNGTVNKWIRGDYTTIKSIPTFTASDTSPDVGGPTTSETGGYSVNGVSLFKTANTVATTIAAFDNALIGQAIRVFINDTFTTIDFTGTTLKGNGGVDWTPTTGDWLEATFDGTNWYCSCHDTTP